MTDKPSIDLVVDEIVEAVEVIADIKAEQRWTVDHHASRNLAATVEQHKTKLRTSLIAMTDFGPQVKKRELWIRTSNEPPSRDAKKFDDMEFSAPDGLIRCPNCPTYPWFLGQPNKNCFKAGCDTCMRHTGYHSTKAEAAEAWNKGIQNWSNHA